jgi:prolyl-tRNA editing enzyme YbaK/EbsC (Cys-tRNA(Pro) deacylase)
MNSDEAHPSVLRVQQALAKLGGDPDLIRKLDQSARTSAEAAQALGVQVSQIVNSLVFNGHKNSEVQPVLVLSSGGHRVDLDLIATSLGFDSISKADADTVKSATGFAIGGVSPVGHLNQLPTLIDLDLAMFGEVWAAAGHPYWVYPTTFKELVAMTGGTAAMVSADPLTR